MACLGQTDQHYFEYCDIPVSLSDHNLIVLVTGDSGVIIRYSATFSVHRIDRALFN